MYMFRPVGEPGPFANRMDGSQTFCPVRKLFARFANFLPGSRTGERFANRPIFANHAKIDVTFLQFLAGLQYIAQLRTGERLQTTKCFCEVHKIKLITNYAYNQLEYKDRDQVLNQ